MSGKTWAAVGAGAAALIGIVVFKLAGQSSAPAAPPAEPPPVVWGDEDPPTFKDAIAKSRQWTGNDEDTTTARSLVLLGWANRHLKWSDVDVHPDETSYELVQKGVEAQLGKRMCVSGTIQRLFRVKTDSARSASGVIVTADQKPFAFMAARNTGGLDEHDKARVCGAVTGWNDAETEVAAAHTVVLVGMFESDKDLP